MSCPCGSEESFENCCHLFLSGEEKPKTAEALMRSRYSAYTKGDIAYIKKTLAPESQHDFDEAASKAWAENAQWLGLSVLSTTNGQAGDKKGRVEFMVKYKEGDDIYEYHENSDFRKNEKGEWLFVDGKSHVNKEGEERGSGEPVVREGPKVGRNDPCPCGSGKKYKKCCA